MNPFDVVISDANNIRILDNRYEDPVDITNGTGMFGCVCYTRRDEDVNSLPKRNYMPHAQHISELKLKEHSDEFLLSDDTLGVICTIQEESCGLKAHWEYRNRVFSKFGAYLPLNFLSQKNGDWRNQFLVSSPYFDPETGCLLCMFTRPDGNHLMLVITTPVEAFRIDYSVACHFFDGFEIILNSDRVYGSMPKDSGEITAYLLPVCTYEEGLAEASRLLCVPCACYRMSSAQIGDAFSVDIVGECDNIIVTKPSGETIRYAGCNIIEIPAEEYGFYRIAPYYQGKKGVECTCFAHCPWDLMYKNSIESVPCHKDQSIGTLKDGTLVWMPPYAQYRGYIDTNLCEHSMWAWSQLRYMQHAAVSNTAKENIENLLRVILADDESAYCPRQTLIPQPQNEPRTMCGYNTYKSDRIQEAFNGANILLEAWRVYGNETYLETAVAVADTILQNNLQDGCICRNLPGNNPEDYTTVTALILPVVDIYRMLRQLGDSRVDRFRAYAEEIADFIVRRDLNFPTESQKNDDYNDEYEDGSISCSALTVLYVAKHVVYKPEYIDFAQKVLQLHDAFSIYTCHPSMFRSSLRWWETIWEGDADGTAICCGHAWSVWRAEAQFWYGLIKKDSLRLLDSYNGFMSNFSKQDQDGNMYAIYQCEPYSSGAYSEAKDVCRQNAMGFPKTKDTTLSRYAYARGYDTWLRCTAVFVDGTVLNGQMINDCLQSKAPYFSMLYLDRACLQITVAADREVEVFCPEPLRCLKGEITRKTAFSIFVKPTSGELILAAIAK